LVWLSHFLLAYLHPSYSSLSSSSPPSLHLLFCFFLEVLQCFKLSIVFHVVFFFFCFANCHHHCHQRKKKSSFFSSSLFYLKFFWGVFLLQKRILFLLQKKKKKILFLPQKKNNFFLLLLLPRELKALLLPPSFGIFCYCRQRSFKLLFFILIVVVCYQRTLKFFFLKNVALSREVGFLVMIHILLLNEK